MNAVGAGDIWNILYIPLAVITASAVRAQWQELHKGRLTPANRTLLLRAALFLLLPVVVFFHELGHALAIWSLSGQVEQFHYGFMWGYVTTANNYTVDQHIWIAFAGNFVEVMIGVAALLIATRSKSPPVVATCTYLGVLSIASCLIAYPLLSATGLYGDWMQIYGLGWDKLTLAIATFHVIAVVCLIWGLTAQAPKKWFAERTDPDWALQHQQIVMLAKASPTPESLTALAWSYLAGGLLGSAAKTIKKLRTLLGDSGPVNLLEGSTELARNHLDQAISCYTKAAQDQGLTTSARLESLLTLANCYASQRKTEASLQAYTQACAMDPQNGDSLIMRACLLNYLGRYQEALQTLAASPDGLYWLNPELAQQWPLQVERATKTKSRN